jgi:hypothetical protein
MLLTGNNTAVAERHRKLARHAVSGKWHQIGFVPEGRRTFNARLQVGSGVPSGRNSYSTTVPGTLSLANIRSRFATAERFYTLQTSRNPTIEQPGRTASNFEIRDIICVTGAG